MFQAIQLKAMSVLFFLCRKILVDESNPYDYYVLYLEKEGFLVILLRFLSLW